MLDRLKSDDPVECFNVLIAEAQQSEVFDATRAALATASEEGAPSVRFVLVREHDADGFVFFTDYRSVKASELDANPHVALAWHWQSTGVQVRLQGRAERAGDTRSDRYFATRPRGSQVGAWASEQSATLDGRATLEAKVGEVTARFEGDVPRPSHWGGYVVTPSKIEFWFNRDDRLHDRVVFRRSGDGWSKRLVYP